MYHLKNFIELTRLNKPIGVMLLFWPCAWGLSYAYNFDQNLNIFLYYLLLFFLGSVLMRSAGCVFNDIVDRDFDKKVQRTKQRPIASGKISVKQSLIYVLILCLISFLILIQFNLKTICLGLGSMILAFSYPYMKRITYWPQLFLGITFNYGLILAWVSINGSISLSPILFYIGAIFWTLGYDTIYGYQDIKDDEIIGVKSTSIKFKENPKKILCLFYFITFLSLLGLGYLMKFSYIYFIFLIIPLLHFFVYQIGRLDIKSPIKCLKLFKSNNFLGLIIFLNLLIGKIL